MSRSERPHKMIGNECGPIPEQLQPQPQSSPDNTMTDTAIEDEHPTTSSGASSPEDDGDVVEQPTKIPRIVIDADHPHRPKQLIPAGVTSRHNSDPKMVRDSPNPDALLDPGCFYLADSSTSCSMSKCSSLSGSSSLCEKKPTTATDTDLPTPTSSSTGTTEHKTNIQIESGGWPRPNPQPDPANTRPDAKWKVRTLGLLAAILPGIGCYFCLAYTLLFQFDNVANFTIPSRFCPGRKSMFPPISYSIGVWKPQKYIWLMVLSLHMPPRFFYAIVHKNHYSLGQSEYRRRRWFRNITRLHFVLLVMEALGLLAVSVIDIETHFKIHASCFALWLIPFNFNMLFNCLLHYHSGIRQLRPMHRRVFHIKCGLFLVGYPLSVSTAISYLTFVLSCNTIAYATFSVAEYFIVGINSVFYFLIVWEFDGSKVEVYIKHRHGHRITEEGEGVKKEREQLQHNHRTI